MKTAILVNGVPASGKSTVARQISTFLGCPLLTLDTIKEPLFEHFGTGDREHNRKLGRASYGVIFSVIGDFPDPMTIVIDAWFGFQPMEVLERHLLTAGIERTAEIWCHAPSEKLAERYASRLGTRSPGHPGADYIPELIALSDRSTPIGRRPVFHVDTTGNVPTDKIMEWLRGVLGPEPASDESR